MLEGFTNSDFQARTYRFGNSIDVGRYPDVDKLDSRQIRELAALLDADKLHTLVGFLDSPFKDVHPGGSRFTDGSFGVYYSAIEQETARIEAHDFYRNIVADGATSRRVAYYRCISCDFAGTVINFMPMEGEHSYLKADTGEDKCRELAREARAAAIDGFLTPSAGRARRGEAGVCLPVFSRASLSNPAEGPAQIFAFDPLPSGPGI